jgi:hypothetical protein
MNYIVPLIALACHFNPDMGYRRANGYDCVAANGVAQGSVTLRTDMTEVERILTTNRAFSRLSYEADARCGADCRFFYGTHGSQCMAVAQSERYTGLGSFMGRQRTRAESEATALSDCRDFVGQPGRECKIIVSQCPPGVG